MRQPGPSPRARRGGGPPAGQLLALPPTRGGEREGRRAATAKAGRGRAGAGAHTRAGGAGAGRGAGPGRGAAAAAPGPGRGGPAAGENQPPSSKRSRRSRPGRAQPGGGRRQVPGGSRWGRPRGRGPGVRRGQLAGASTGSSRGSSWSGVSEHPLDVEGCSGAELHPGGAGAHRMRVAAVSLAGTAASCGFVDRARFGMRGAAGRGSSQDAAEVGLAVVGARMALRCLGVTGVTRPERAMVNSEARCSGYAIAGPCQN